MQRSEVVWHGLLNCAEARVLSSVEERELLVELVDCKKRILEALPPADDAIGHESSATARFQQLIRDLADPDVTSPPAPSGEIKRQAQRYQELRAKLAMANVRLVAHVAKRYQDRGVPPGDLVQEGFCALLVAIDRFDLANETRLATYAIWWIRQAIQRAVAGGAYPVRLNPRQLHQLAQAQATSAGIARDPKTRSDSPRPAFSPTIEQVFAATRPVFSLDAPSRHDENSTLGEFLVPSEDPGPQGNDAHLAVGDLIKTLTAREQLVLKLRFGLADESPHTLIQVSHVLGVSKERVRQIQDRALAKLRASSAGSPPAAHPRKRTPASQSLAEGRG